MWAAMWGALASAGCPEPWSSEQLGEAIDVVEDAYRDLDERAFEPGIASMFAGIGCLSEVPDRAALSRLHRIVGIHRYIHSAEPESIAAFRASRVIEPRPALPLELVPEGVGVRAVWAAAGGGRGPSRRVVRPRGALFFDGSPARTRPEIHAVLIQHADRRGAITASHYLFPGEPLPDYPQLRPGPWLGSAAASAAIATTTYGLAWASRARVEAIDTQRRFDQVQRTTNGLVIASAAATGIAIGTGTVGLWRAL